jgi:RNA polymerase sigma-70 factor (ECF subfamily)
VDTEANPISAERSDDSLLRRFRSGDEDAATALYRRYARRLLALAESKTSTEFATRFDAEDVVQSVFRSFFRRARDGYYQVPDSGELWQLLLVLSLNKIRRLAIHHRAQKRDVRATILDEILPEHPTHEHSEDDVAFGVLKMVVEDTISELTATQQSIVRDRIEGFEVSEIAERVNRSKRTVERTLQQFRQQLARIIDND